MNDLYYDYFERDVINRKILPWQYMFFYLDYEKFYIPFFFAETDEERQDLLFNYYEGMIKNRKAITKCYGTHYNEPMLIYKRKNKYFLTKYSKMILSIMCQKGIEKFENESITFADMVQRNPQIKDTIAFFMLQDGYLS